MHKYTGALLALVVVEQCKLEACTTCTLVGFFVCV